MNKILALDLDGTLFYPKGHKRYVSKKNTSFIRKFVSEGNKVVLVSSRTSEFCEKVIKELNCPIDYIALTGCIIKVDGKIVQNLAMSNENISSILSEIQKQYQPIAYILTCKGQPLILRVFINVGKWLAMFYMYWYKFYFGIYREDFVASINKFEKQLKSGTLYSVKCFFGFGKKTKAFNKKLNKILAEKYPSIECSWMGIALEFSPHGCNKGNALKTYLNFANHKEVDDVYVVGDSGNDIAMFKAFNKNSYVMKHAVPSVKKYARYKISRVYKLEKVLLERSKHE